MRTLKDTRPSIALPLLGLTLTGSAFLCLLFVLEHRPTPDPVRLLVLKPESQTASGTGLFRTPETVSTLPTAGREAL
jgi:hypothetical protein